MAMESRLLQVSGVTAGLPRAGTAHNQQGSFRVAAQRFMRGVDLESGRFQGRRVSSRSGSVIVVAARRPAAQEEAVVSKDEYVESVSEPQAHESSYVGSPLLWIGVGVGLSALFSFGANQVKRYAMQQMLKSMTGGAGGASPFGGPGANPFGAPGAGNPFAGMPMPPPGSQFPFPMPPPPSAASPAPVSAAAAAPPVDVAPTSVTSNPPPTSAKGETPTTPTSAEPRKPAFTDVSADDILEREQQAAARFNDQPPSASEPTRPFFADADVSNSAAGAGPSSNAWTDAAKGKGQTVFSVEQLEKMMEDPTVQKMVYPYLPEEMRNPTTFKWMMQNPQYRQQLQDMLNSMGGDGAWDNRMSDMLKNFDLNSTEVKQQFEQIGLTPEEVVAKIMANPEVAVAFQNPKVQAAIMDCSTNPLNITKYQNDKEVMDVFNKISELFPGMTGSPF